MLRQREGKGSIISVSMLSASDSTHALPKDREEYWRKRDEENADKKNISTVSAKKPVEGRPVTKKTVDEKGILKSFCCETTETTLFQSVNCIWEQLI